MTEAVVRENDLERQKLWVAMWGTVAALVWATTQEWAEERVRRQVFDRRRSGPKILEERVVVTGEVRVRLATEADLQTWEDVGGRLPSNARPDLPKR